MAGPLARMLEADKIARADIDDAEKYRQDTLASIVEEKKKINDNADAQTERLASQLREKQQASGSKKLETAQADAAQRVAKLRELREAHMDERVETIYERVIGACR